MFNFDLSDDQTTLVIRIEERSFDITNSTQFRAAVGEAWKDSIEDVSVDFSQVEFIDSSGVGSLVSVHKRVLGKGKALKVINACPAVISVIELLRLHRVFQLVKA